MTRALVAVSDPTYGGVYYSDNIDFTSLTTQPTWTKLATTGLANTLVKVMRCDPVNPYDNIYLQLDNDNIYRWNGVSWTLILDTATAQAFLATGALGYIATNQITAGKVYLAIQTVAQVKLLYSSDYGATWNAEIVDTDLMTGSPYVAAYEDSVVVCTGEIYRMAYTGSIGGGWTPIYLWNNSGGGATIRIDPANPAYFYYRKDSSDADLIRAGGGAITEIQNGNSLASNLDWHEHMHWIDPTASAHQRILRSLSNNVSVYSTVDSWVNFVNATPTVLKAGFLKAVGAHRAARENPTYAMFGVTEELGGQGLVEAFVGDNPAASYIIAGTNWNTSPYTNAIPYTANAHVAFDGIWVGEGISSAQKGIYIYSVETDTYDYDHHPMIGDRSAHHTLSYPDEHAEDVQKDTPTIHVPWPVASGNIPVSNGSYWVETTPGDFGIIDTDTLHGHVVNEDHTDECNGVTVAFPTDVNFLPETTAVYLNGLRQRLHMDYTEAISLDSITTTTAPEAGDILEIDYICSYEDGINMARRILISEQTPTGTTVTWDNIPAIYKSLQIELTGRCDRVGQINESVYLFFNNDTTATNYFRQNLYGTASSAISGNADNSSVIALPAATATANYPGYATVEILDYADTTFHKTAHITNSRREDATTVHVGNQALYWESTVAITRVDLVTVNGSNFIAGTKVRLYGVY